MPLKLFPPRPGKTPYWQVRGTYLGQHVDRSTKLADRRKAAKVLEKWKQEIERGEFAVKGDPTFLSAAVAYMKDGGDRRFIAKLLDHFGNTPLKQITQQSVDEAGHALYPKATPATRNRQVHTPVSAILRHAGQGFEMRRPEGAQGEQRTQWLWPEQAFRIFASAAHPEGGNDPEFRIFLAALCYTGMRLSDALGLKCDDTRIAENFAWLPKTKNGEPRGVYLPPVVVAELANLPNGLERPGERVFRFRKNGYLYNLLKATKKHAGKDLSWVTFHTFCHTWATWMRRYGGLDTRGLVGTGRWKNAKSATRYEHVVVSEESQRAMHLPTEGSMQQTVEKSWTKTRKRRKVLK